jgi:hypothetical protein
MNLSKKQWALVVLALVVLGAVGALPSFSYVSVRGPDGDVTVQKAGFGNNGIHVQTDTADIKVNSR